jgi:hypothetical protein
MKDSTFSSVVLMACGYRSHFLPNGCCNGDRGLLADGAISMKTSYCCTLDQ